jgi:adenine-specific DNA-methyltransferase
MHPKPLKLRAALNKAYLKIKPTREQIEPFKAHLVTLLDRLRLKETEEHHKKHIATFLEDTFYKQSHHLNAKGDIDLAIYTGKSPKDPVGVILEVKRPDNEAEMFGADNPAAKSMCELLLYYLRERVDADNQDLRHMVITNGYDWFIFDTSTFDRLFFSKGSLKKDYIAWRDDRKAATTTAFFYNHIAKPLLITGNDTELPYVHLDLRTFEKAARNQDLHDDAKLIVLYKLLSPSHLLKEPFANDSNSLNKDFYSELLHIIGLEEAKDKNKKVIRRHDAGKRHEGALLEHAIERFVDYVDASSISNRRSFGDNAEEQQFGIGLELCITWVNRILFLKLLEAQLRSYHQGDIAYRFLDPKAIRDFDELNDLFFLVLAKRQSNRNPKLQTRYGRVPYLNSSLFERTKLEDEAFSINELNNHITLQVHSRTVLRDGKGKRLTGEMGTLEYLLKFLEAYDFSAEGGEEIQEENKTLINASVLGLIFEKINGYRDGSFFTPGFVTMYMCRETLRSAVVQKFNEAYGWDAADLDQLRDLLQAGAAYRADYNALVNNLRVCDPAVGSGHFLVSALNELLAIKSDLGILAYHADGSRVKEYGVRVENDELVVLDYEEYKPFQYRLGRAGKPLPELQKLQETLFHEKQTIIENCLFGVDINPNSVKICRLRLWIELLKHAYYTAGSDYADLETLPNIDINIKQGNSLVSRFGLQDALGAALKESGHSVAEYREAVQGYRHASSSEEKKAMLAIIDGVKSVFKDTIDKPLQRKIAGARGTHANLEQEIANLRKFGMAISAKLQQDHDKAKAAFEAAVLERKEIEENVLYREAFEWRFEFPEVLDTEGEFGGFDVVIANPPYIRQEEIKEYKEHFAARFKAYVSSADLYVYFVELGMSLLRPQGSFCYIIPNKWMRAGYGSNMRQWLLGYDLQGIVDFGDLPVFEEATTYPCILSMCKQPGGGHLMAAEIPSLDMDDLGSTVRSLTFAVTTHSLDARGWTLMRNDKAAVLAKIRSQGVPLGEYVGGKIYYGIKTGLNEAFVIDAATRDRLIAEDARSAEVIKPFLAGREIKRYHESIAKQYLILITAGFTNAGRLDRELPWEFIERKYPSIAKFLLAFQDRAEKRSDQGDYWWELRACAYYDQFGIPKIQFAEIAVEGQFSIDRLGSYCDTTGYIIASDSQYLLALLNSSLILFCLGTISSSIRGGYFRWKKQYMELLPIVSEKTANERGVLSNMQSLVDRIDHAKSQNPLADTTMIEAEIDRVVYQLYGLEEAEILVVEGAIYPE